MAQRQAALKAKLEAAKLPPASLSETQVAKLKEMYAPAQIVWYRAGQRSDGKIYVCLVTQGKNLWGGAGAPGLISGTFEPDGSFARTLAYLMNGDRAVLKECHVRGFEPPVMLCQASILATNCQRD
jgi:hypothetical protein